MIHELPKRIMSCHVMSYHVMYHGMKEQKPLDGPIGFHRGEGDAEWPEDCVRAVRAHQHLWFVLQEQAEVPRQTAQAHQHQPGARPVPPPCPRAYLPPCHPWHDPAQDPPWQVRDGARKVLRGCA